MRGFDPRELAAEQADDGLPPIGGDALTAFGLRNRFERTSRHRWSPEIVSDHRSDSPSVARPAAVLVPIFSRAELPRVLLTVRPSHLRVHSGQIAFPGGRVEPTDANRIATAQREAQEEVGLAPHDMEILGELPIYRTGTGFEVTPVVCLVPGDPPLRPDPAEVAETFLVPLEFLMNPRNHQRRYVPGEQGGRAFYAIPWRDADTRIEYFIWGVTAAILRNLFQFLRA